MTSVLSPLSLPAAWRTALVDHGFVPRDGTYHQNGTIFLPGDAWLVLETHALESFADDRDLGQPGLWRTVIQGGCVRRRFEVPAQAVARADAADEEDAGPGLAPYLAWAQATACCGLPVGWQPPSIEAVQEWVPAEALTWRGGPLVRQGELILEPSRWALRFPIVPSLPAVLPPVREQWLRTLCREAQACWRMVRAGVVATPDGRSLVAEVDLSGAPPAAPLVLAGLSGLRYVVAWLAEAAELLADVSTTLHVLEPDGCPTPTERTEP